jgi:uncharacterized protein YbjT (DUF2867 family)
MAQSITLVVGGTGTIGRHVVRQLLDAGHAVRALLRDPAKVSLFDPHPAIVVGDLTRPETLPRAFTGVDRAFVLAPPAPDLATLEGAAFDAAKAASVRRIVYLSNFGAGVLGPPDSIWGWHGASERRLRALGLPWTILRPARFMTDTPFAWTWDRKRGEFAEPLGAGKVTMIAPEDVAAVAVRALMEPGHDGQAYELTAAQALDGAEIAEILARVTGEPTRFVDIAPAAARDPMLAFGIPPFVVDTVMEYFAGVREGRWYVTSTAAKVLGRAPLSYAEWLGRELSTQAPLSSG